MSVNNPHQQFQLLERRKAFATRYLHGESQYAIARALEVGQATISRDLATVREEWRKSAQLDIADRVAQEIAKLDALEREYYKAWERSCLPKTIRGVRARSAGKRGADGKPLEASEKLFREEIRDGNAGFLQGVERCILRRCELLGLLQRPGTGATTVVTVVGGIDLSAVIGQKPGIPLEHLHGPDSV
jgi:hypothetical protein